MAARLGETDTYDAVMDIVKTHCGAYGVGVEYAYTMVHGAPPTRVRRSTSFRRLPATAQVATLDSVRVLITAR